MTNTEGEEQGTVLASKDIEEMGEQMLRAVSTIHKATSKWPGQLRERQLLRWGMGDASEWGKCIRRRLWH